MSAVDKNLQEAFEVVSGLNEGVAEKSLPYDECVASGAGHYYKLEEIPSEFITGIAGSTEFVYQCAYCGKARGSHV